MGKIKDLAIQIEENDNDDYMAYMLGITVEEFQMLIYEIKGDRIDFMRTLAFDITKSPVEILSKIKNLKDGNSVTFDMCKLYKI
jgi:hypothetical protein